MIIIKKHSFISLKKTLLKGEMIMNIKNNEKIVHIAGIAICFALTIAVYFFGKSLSGIAHLPDTGASWYYWKLPAPSLYAQISAWTLFALHLISVWYLMYKLKKDPLRKAGKMSKYNTLLLITNFIFIALQHSDY